MFVRFFDIAGDVATGEGVETSRIGRLTRLSFMVAVKAIVERGTSALLFRDNCPGSVDGNLRVTESLVNIARGERNYGISP